MADCRSSTHQRWPSVFSWQCRRETPESVPQSTAGWMLRETDGRPTSTLRSRSGTSPGSPADGIGSSAFCAAYQSGSTQISATQESSPSGAGVGRAVPGSVSPEPGCGAGVATGTGAESGAGSEPLAGGVAGAGRAIGAGAATGAGAVPVVKS